MLTKTLSAHTATQRVGRYLGEGSLLQGWVEVQDAAAVARQGLHQLQAAAAGRGDVYLNAHPQRCSRNGSLFVEGLGALVWPELQTHWEITILGTIGCCPALAGQSALQQEFQGAANNTLYDKFDPMTCISEGVSSRNLTCFVGNSRFVLRSSQARTAPCLRSPQTPDGGRWARRSSGAAAAGATGRSRG